MQLHTICTYQIDEHPDPESVYDWIRSHWHDLGDYTVEESVDSLKEFCQYYDLGLDYAVSIVPDRGEFITAKVTNDDLAEMSGVRLWKYLNKHYQTISHHSQTGKRENIYAGNCPFTGVCYDETLLDEIRDFLKKPDTRTFQELIDDCTHKLLTAIHSEGEYLYSDEGLRDMCEANEYEFTENGNIY